MRPENDPQRPPPSERSRARASEWQEERRRLLAGVRDAEVERACCEERLAEERAAFEHELKRLAARVRLADEAWQAEAACLEAERGRWAAERSKWADDLRHAGALPDELLDPADGEDVPSDHDVEDGGLLADRYLPVESPDHPSGPFPASAIRARSASRPSSVAAAGRPYVADQPAAMDAPYRLGAPYGPNVEDELDAPPVTVRPFARHRTEHPAGVREDEPPDDDEPDGGGRKPSQLGWVNTKSVVIGVIVLAGLVFVAQRMGPMMPFVGNQFAPAPIVNQGGVNGVNPGVAGGFPNAGVNGVGGVNGGFPNAGGGVGAGGVGGVPNGVSANRFP